MEQLPPDLLVSILGFVTDITTLDNLLRASPNAWRCFDSYGVDIAEQVLDSDPMHFHVRDMIRIAAFIREGRLPIKHLAYFRKRIACEVIRHRERPYRSRAFQPKRFPRWPPVEVRTTTIRSLFATFRRISYETLECLDFFMERFRRLRPLRPVSPDCIIDSQSLAHLRRSSPEKEAIPLLDPEPPWTWAEEQVVMRSFWRMRLLHDLRAAIRRGLISHWPECDVETLNRCSTIDIYRMEDLVRPSLSIWGITMDRGRRQRCSQPTEHSVILNVCEYRRERQCKEIPPAWSRPSPVPTPMDGEEAVMIDHWSVGPDHFECLLRRDGLKQTIEFDFFRCHGFAIWSRKRLKQHGFGTTGRHGSGDVDLAAWVSVMPEDQLTRLEAWGLENQKARGIDVKTVDNES